jgi:hypothetical protein
VEQSSVASPRPSFNPFDSTDANTPFSTPSDAQSLPVAHTDTETETETQPDILNQSAISFASIVSAVCERCGQPISNTSVNTTIDSSRSVNDSVYSEHYLDDVDDSEDEDEYDYAGEFPQLQQQQQQHQQSSASNRISLFSAGGFRGNLTGFRPISATVLTQSMCVTPHAPVLLREGVLL